MQRVKLKDRDIFELPLGYWTDSGKLVKTFAVNPITGRLCQKIIQASERKTTAELLNNATVSIVASLGGEPFSRQMLEKMTVADRDYILLVSSFLEKTKQELTRECPHCQTEVHQDIDLEDVEVLVPDEEDFERRGNTWVYDYVDEDLKLTAKFRLRTTEDEEGALKGGRDKLAWSGAAFMVSRCCLDFNGKGTLTEKNCMEDLKMSVFGSLQDGLNAKDVGPDLEFVMDCPSCGKDVQIFLDVVTHFLGGSARKVKRKL